MKILYLIFNSGSGVGGHYHSLNQISRLISTKVNVGIVSIGTKVSPIIEANPNYLCHLDPFGFTSFFSFKKKYSKLLNDFQPSILHFFDTDSLNACLLVKKSYSFPIVLTKCGGPNPIKAKWQFVYNLTLFSKENQSWFTSRTAYKESNIHLIPNRVSVPKVFPENERLEKKDENKINFVRVGRIEEDYEKTILDSLNLMEILTPDFAVHLYIIGRIHSTPSYNRIQSIIKEKELFVTFITDDRANVGANFLYLADFVIGTGRSLIEGLALGIPCLTPVSNYDIPVLVNQRNFDVFFTTNFSERNVYDYSLNDANIESLKRAIKIDSSYEELSNISKQLFEEHFNILNSTEKYLNVYRTSIIGSKLKLLSNNILYLVRSMYQLSFKELLKYGR